MTLILTRTPICFISSGKFDHRILFSIDILQQKANWKATWHNFLSAAASMLGCIVTYQYSAILLLNIELHFIFLKWIIFEWKTIIIIIVTSTKKRENVFFNLFMHDDDNVSHLLIILYLHEHLTTQNLLYFVLWNV